MEDRGAALQPRTLAADPFSNRASDREVFVDRGHLVWRQMDGWMMKRNLWYKFLETFKRTVYNLAAEWVDIKGWMHRTADFPDFAFVLQAENE